MPDVISDNDLTGKSFGYIDVLNYHKKTNSWYVRYNCIDCYYIARMTRDEILNGYAPTKIMKKLVGNPYIVYNDGTVRMFDIKGDSFVVDYDDFLKIRDITWNVHYGVKNGTKSKLPYPLGGYMDKDTNKWVSLTLSRYIMDLYDDELQVDHINLDTLDNTRKNLRIVKQSQNMMNRTTFKSNELGIKGVRLDKRTGVYQARITVDTKQIYLGESKDINEAKRLREEAEKRYFGEFSNAVSKSDNKHKKGDL